MFELRDSKIWDELRDPKSFRDREILCLTFLDDEQIALMRKLDLGRQDELTTFASNPTSRQIALNENAGKQAVTLIDLGSIVREMEGRTNDHL